MLQVTGDQLKTLAPYLDPAKCAILAEAITEALPEGNINTPRRLAHFMAQCAHETWGFKHLVESLFYTDAVHLLHTFPGHIVSLSDAKDLIQKGPEAIGNRIYANVLGNGDEDSGDGWRYRGRGFIQLTGKYNYKTVGRQTGAPLDRKPEILEDPKQAAISAAKFWDFHACNEHADSDDITSITHRINPSLDGFDDRRNWYMKTSKIWA